MESVELKSDEKPMKAILTTSHDVIFKCVLNKFLGFRKKYPAATYLKEKPTNTANIGKVHLNCDCVVGSVVNGGRKRISSFGFSAPRKFETFKEPTSFLFKITTESNFGDIIFYIEEEDGSTKNFNGEN